MPACRVTVIALALAALPGLGVAPAAAQGALSNGANHTGSIDGPGEIDEWTFTANQNDAVVLNVGEVGGDSEFRPWIRVTGPTGATLVCGNCWGDLATQMAATIPLSGTYTVRIASADGGNDATGDYVLTLAHTPGPFSVSPGDEGGALTNGLNHTGRIEVGDLDLWSFPANQGDRVVLNLGEIVVAPGAPDPGFRPWIRVYGPGGATLVCGNCWGELAAQMEATIPLSGSYTVVISTADGGNDAVGDYTLTLARAPGAFQLSPGDHGGALTNGLNHTGRLEVGDLDLWTFTANQNDSVVLNLGEIVVGPGTPDPGFRPWIRVFGPNGATLVCGNCWGDLAAQMAATVPLTGTYTVVISTADGENDAVGDYVLTLARAPGAFQLSPGDQGGPLTNGLQHSGRIEVGDLDMWTFAASQGDAVAIAIGEIPVGPSTPDPGYRPWIRVFGPNGATLVCGNCWGDLTADMAATIPLTGTYTVVVSTADGANDAVGDYRLTLARIPAESQVSPGDQGGPLTNGVNHTGRIDLGDLDTWTFTAVQGASLTLTLTEIPVGPSVPDPGFRPWLRLYGPTGATVLCGNCWHDDVVTVNPTAPLTGTYTVVVYTADGGNDAVGDYTLRVLGATVPPGPPITGADGYAVTKDTTLNVAAPGVLANDVSPGGAVMSPVLVTPPANGGLVLAVNGAVTYTPNPGFTGTDVFTYRATDVNGAGNVASVTLTVSAVTTVQPPAALYAHAIAGAVVTLRWSAPVSGPAPTGYVLEGGIAPGQALASVPTGSRVPIFTFAAPTGAFYLRIRALDGAQTSGTSNEIRVFVNQPVPPSAPSHLLGLVNGAALALSWRPTFAGGAASTYVLDVSGTLSGSAPVGLTDTFTFNGVPGGTYTFSVRAVNAFGSSAASNPMTLTFPNGCSGPPETPADFLAYAVGNTVSLLWNPAAAGPAPTTFVLGVSGAFNINLPVATRGVSGAVPPGSYTFTVTAANSCGASAATAAQTVVVP